MQEKLIFPKPDKLNNLKTGREGETVAKSYLINKGYKIIDENYQTKYAEIDLVAYFKQTLIFVEVRAKVGEKFGTPEDSINRNKKLKLLKNARAYVGWKRYRGRYRIDAVCIVFDESGDLKRINHYEDIFF